MSTVRESRGVWWLSPVGAVALVVPGTLLLASLLSDSAFRDSYRTPKSLTSSTVTLLLAGALVFALGSLWPLLRGSDGTRARRLLLNDTQRFHLERIADVLFWVTLAGYAAFVISGIRNGVTLGQIGDALGRQHNYTGDLKRQFASITGVTTLTQVGIAYVIVALVLLFGRPDRRLPRRLALVLGLGLGRAFLLTERLAILELLVPLAALVAMRLAGSRKTWAQWAVPLAPLLLIPAVVVVFGLFEYSRSWTYYSTRTSQPFPEFAALRLAGYYVTAYNNGHLALTYDPYPGRVPYASVEALWTAPGVQQLGLYSALSAPGAPQQYPDLALLEQYGNPEFNSPCGLAVPFVDYGSVGGLLFLFAAGSVLGMAYRAFRDNRITALFVYPVLVTGLFELPRYLYWTQGRAAPALAALLATGFWLSQYGKRMPAAALEISQRDTAAPAALVQSIPATRRALAALAAAEQRARVIGDAVLAAANAARRSPRTADRLRQASARRDASK